AAYEARDLEALRRLEDELPARDGVFPGTTATARIAWASRQMARLEQTLSDLKSKIARLKSSDRYRMWEKLQADPVSWERLEANYKREIISKQRRLEELITTYRNGVHASVGM